MRSPVAPRTFPNTISVVKKAQLFKITLKQSSTKALDRRDHWI